MKQNKQHQFVHGCLIVVTVSVVVIAVTVVGLSMAFSAYWYRIDNAERRDPMENLARFHRELKTYLAEHEGRYPPGQGVAGLGELVVLLSDLRVKDDTSVDTDPDFLYEGVTSYAYVASGLSQTELDGSMPVIFEKPRNRDRIRVLLSDGRIEVLECKGFKNCRGVIEYYRERSKKASPAWKALLRNAEYYREF